MAVNFNVTLIGQSSLVGRVEALPANVRQKLKAKVTILAYQLMALVKQKLSNQVLHVRTGALRDSIAQKVTDTGTGIVGKVFSSGNVKYAAIHEFGGQTSAHLIEANKAKALAFMMNGKQVFAKSVQHPGSKIPERSYLRSSLADMAVQIEDEMISTVKQAAAEVHKQ